MVFLDVEKAFDSVWHEGLLHKLVISNCCLYLTKIIASFLSGRSFHVSVNKTDSAIHPIPYGVPQGAILSPSLYNFFTADLPQSNESETATFADDTAIFVSSKDPKVVCDVLQRHLDSLSTYFKKWKIKINASKTQAIYFTRCWAPRKLPSTFIKIGGHPIPWSTEVKYLGVTLDKKLTFASHMARSIEKSEKAFRILYSFFNRKSKLNTFNKLLLFKACIRSILCYGVETWYHCAYTHKKKLQIIQNKCLKIIMNRNWRYSTAALHEESNIPLIEEFSEKIYSKFIDKCRFSHNPMIANIAS
jgi:Reverse transcriptase (RNA-dependent DNA polymerase)